MKKAEREPYLILARLPGGEGYGLCSWCKFGEFSGWSCCEVELECQHALGVINGEDDDGEHPNNVWGYGDDCWGFRPKYTLQECGVIASIRATGRMAHKSKTYGEWIAIVPSKREREEMGIG